MGEEMSLPAIPFYDVSLGNSLHSPYGWNNKSWQDFKNTCMQIPLTHYVINNCAYYKSCFYVRLQGF